MEIAAIGLRGIITGAVDVEKTKACIALGNMPLVNAKVGMLEAQNRMLEAKTIEVAKINKVIATQIEAMAAE
jgi:hypothetical protein